MSKRKATKVSLCELLEPYVPVVIKGQITTLRDDGGNSILLQQVAPGAEGYLEEHPEGSDRGGYVPTIFMGDDSAYWDDLDSEWV